MLAGVVSTLSGFFGGVVVARVLGVEGAGTVAFAMWLATTVATVGDLGFPASLARFLPELLARGQTTEAHGLSSSLFSRMLTATASILACFVALVLLAGMSGEGTHLIGGVVRSNWASIASLFTAQLLGNYFLAYLKGFQRFDTCAVLAVVSALTQFVAILIGSMAFGVRGALFGYLAGTIIPGALSWTVVRKHGWVPKELKLRVWQYSRNSWAATIVSAIVWSRTEILFLEHSWGNTEVGLFNVSLTFAALATQGPMLMTGGLVPYFAERYGMADIEGLRRAYGSATRVLAFLIFPACLGTAAIVPKLLPLLFGQDFVPAVPTAMILVSVAGFGAISSVSATFVNTMERTNIIFVTGLGCAALSIAAGITVIPAFGINGAAASRTFVQLIGVASGYWYVSRRLDCPVPFRDIGRIFVAALVCAFTARIILESVAGLWSLPMAILTGAIVYCVALRLLGGLPKDDVALLERWALVHSRWIYQIVRRNWIFIRA